MNFIYTVDPNADQPIMLINGNIGESVNGAQFQSELYALDTMNKSRIKVYINSAGGSVLEGYNIASSILNSKTKVDTYCMGVCASSSCWIFEAGAKRYMSDFGLLWVHNVAGLEGEAQAKFNSSISTILSQKTGKTESEIANMMTNETWFDASQAIESGFADEIIYSKDMNRPRLTKTANSWELASNYLTSITKPIIKMDLSKICNALDLNPEASEMGILKAIEQISNKANTELNDVRNQLATITGAKNALVTENEALKSEIEAKKTELETAKNEALEIKATALVESYISKGALKADKKDEMIQSAKNAYEATETILKALPITVQGIDLAKIENKVIIPTNAMGMMAELNSKRK